MKLCCMDVDQMLFKLPWATLHNLAGRISPPGLEYDTYALAP